MWQLFSLGKIFNQVHKIFESFNKLKMKIKETFDGSQRIQNKYLDRWGWYVLTVKPSLKYIKNK